MLFLLPLTRFFTPDRLDLPLSAGRHGGGRAPVTEGGQDPCRKACVFIFVHAKCLPVPPDWPRPQTHLDAIALSPKAELPS